MLKLSIVGWYASNVDYVSKRLCENRNRPAMHCNGKCYLYKQLAKADGADKNNKQRLADVSKLELPPFEVPEGLQLRGSFIEERASWVAYQAPFADEVMLRIFHPPG
jgi:hypothetical protein